MILWLTGLIFMLYYEEIFEDRPNRASKNFTKFSLEHLMVLLLLLCIWVGTMIDTLCDGELKGFNSDHHSQSCSRRRLARSGDSSKSCFP